MMILRHGLFVIQSDTITYFAMTMAVMRAGYIVFPISPRNSSAAVAHLIRKVNVRCVLVGLDNATISLGQEAVTVLETQHPNNSKPGFVPIPRFEDLFLDTQEDPDDIPFEKPKPDDVTMYLHSSGVYHIYRIDGNMYPHSREQALLHSQSLYPGRTFALPNSL